MATRCSWCDGQPRSTAQPKAFVSGRRTGRPERYLQDLAGGPPRPLTAEGVSLAKLGRPVSPDGRRVVAIDTDGMPALYPLDGGEPVRVPGLGELDVPMCWTPEGRGLMVARYEDMPPRVERVEVATGQARPWQGLGRSLPTALWGQGRLLVSPDGESYAYTAMRAG